MPRDQRRSHVRRSNVTACTRCRSRKQRCDQQLPACSSCEHAGVECVSTDIDGRVAPRSYMKSLEDRIAYLETQLISHGIQDAEMLPADLSPLAGNNPSAAPTPPQETDNQPQDLVGQIALESLQANPFATSIVNRNGLPLLSSLLAGPVAKVLRSDGTSDHHALLHELPYETRASIPPKDACRRLIDTYFEHCDFFSPIISSKEAFFNTLEPLYGSSTPSRPLVTAKFRSLIVFGTAVLLLNRSDPSVPISRSEGYFAAAVRVLSQNPDSICTGDLDHLTNLLLVIQHCCFCSNLTAAWHFIGLATRLAVELNLHNEQAVASQLDPDTINTRRWLFWSTYIFERNLCVIIGRPFSITDEAIKTPLPDSPNGDPQRLLALHLIKCRRLESEMHTTLNHSRPSNGALLNTAAWKTDMRQRLLNWHESVPPLDRNSQLAPAGIFNGYFHNAMVLLHYPSPLLPTTSSEDVCVLAEHATRSIDCYKQAFREGKLRFYWRTVHNLFRSGIAAVYCSHVAGMQLLDLGLGDIWGAINSCSSILWGMVERYPAGKAYRDIFESVVSSVMKQDQSHPRAVYNQCPPIQRGEQLTLFDQISSGFEDTDIPLPAMDALSWGFSGSHAT